MSAIVVTHEHGDHVRGVGPLARACGASVWMTSGSARACARVLGEVPDLRIVPGHAPFSIGDIELAPFPVPHDALEPVQFVFSDGRARLGVLTDAGCVTPHMRACLNRVGALMLECNHDRRLLENGSYPPALKQRIGGRLGHLDNEQAADLLGSLDTRRLHHVVAAHLSENNNTPMLAQAALARVLGGAPDDVAVADQDDGLDWRELIN